MEIARTHPGAKSARLREHHSCYIAAGSSFLHYSTPFLWCAWPRGFRLAVSWPTNGYLTPFRALPRPLNGHWQVFLNNLLSQDGKVLSSPDGEAKAVAH